MELTSNLVADYARSLSFDELPEEAVESVTRLTLDSIGCCLGAYTSPPSKHLRSVYGSIGIGDEGPTQVEDGDGSATVFGAGTQTLPEHAALINSTMVRYLDYNDTYINEGRACHPSDHIPALIAVAEAEEVTGTELVEAIVVAYEIEGLCLDTGVTWNNGYDYVTWGAYSTAAAAGKLMGLTRQELVSAIGIAGASNLTLGVSRRGEVSMWKGAAHAYACHSAIEACRMARAGLTGPERVFQGPGGFIEVAAENEPTVERLGGRDGAAYRVTRTHLKPFPCGYYMQPMITGVHELVVDNDLSPDTIRAIDIETFTEAVDVLGGEEKWSTDLTRESADHSIPYTAAIAAIHGDVSPEHYAEKYRTNSAVHELMERVNVHESKAMNEVAAAKPDSTPSVIRIRTDGGTYETRVDYALGHVQNPLSMEQIEVKAREMAEPLLTDDEVERVFRYCAELPKLSSVDSLVRALVV